MTCQPAAIVTGANKGLGLSIVKRLCEESNGTVYLTSRDEKRGKTACEEIRKLGLNLTYHQLDVTDKNSIKQFLHHIQDNNIQIDILINNAGILFLKDSTDPKIYQAEQTIFVNFTSLVNFTEAILPFCKNGAKIVNISSSSGHLSRILSKELRNTISSEHITLADLRKLANEYIGDVKDNKEIERGWGDSPYVVSKVLVNAYTFLLHRRLVQRGITVNCVHPGYVMSDMTRGSGSISPEDAAKVPVGLALDPSGSGLYVWHNGQTVPWDGDDPRTYIDGRK